MITVTRTSLPDWTDAIDTAAQKAKDDAISAAAEDATDKATTAQNNAKSYTDTAIEAALVWAEF